MKASSSNGKIKGFLIKGVSLIMAICMLMPTGCKRQNNTDTQESKDNNNQTVQTNRADKPTDLKINLLADPFGVDKNDLRFSWVMNDPDKNEMQTAYRILISRSSAKISEKDYLFDSGWVESGDNTAVSLAGLDKKLEENSLYYWCVGTRDKDSNECFSDPQPFSTAVGEKWASLKGIWAGNVRVSDGAADSASSWKDYTLDVEFTVDETALGFVFRAADQSNFYMWQFKATGSGSVLYPHVFKNGSFVGNSYIAAVNLPSRLSFTTGQTVNARIVCKGNTVETYVKGSDNEYTMVDSRDMSQYGFSSGVIGVRTGRTETGKISSMTVTDNSGNLLYRSDFSSGVSPFAGCTLSGGKLVVPKSLSNGSIYKQNNHSFAFLRTEAVITEAQMSRLDKAVLSVSATSPENTRQFVYNMYVNGTLVGVGPSRYGKTASGQTLLYYNTYDVTSLVSSGKNCLSAINYATAGRAFICQLTLHYTDGSSEVLSCSGRDYGSWRSLPADEIFGKDNSIGTGHFSAHANNINSFLYPHGFFNVGFDDSLWNEVSVTDNIASQMLLTPSQTDNMSRYESDGKITVKKIGSSYVIDLGAEIIGGLRFTAELPKAADVKVYYGEQLNSNGTVKYNMLTGNNYVESWKLTEGKQTVETIDMLAFRYVQIQGCPVEITADMIKGLEIRAEFDGNESSFNSDSKLLNDIYALMKRTVKITTQDLYVDSQSRERLAYEGDLIINLLASYAFEDDYSIGRFSNEYLFTHRTWPAEYLLFSSISAVSDYMTTGDIASLENNYTLLKNRVFTNFLDKEYSLLTTGNSGSSGTNAILTDWPTSERDGYDTGVKFNTVLNSVAVGAYESLALIASLTGHDKEAKQFEELGKAVKDAMILHLYDADKGAFADGLHANGKRSAHYAQHATAYALAFGIYEDQEMADRLAASIKETGKIKMSVYGAFFLLKGLYESGNGDIANTLLLDPDTSQGARTWAYMLYSMNATVTTEAWNSVNKSNMTLSHPWGAAPAYAIMSGIFGINPTSAGYGSFEVRFCTGGLGNASITVPTVKGKIGASFEKSEGVFKASVTVPANTTATVYLPASQGAAVTVDGSSVDGNYENGYVAVTVGSGTWEFTVK